MPIERSALIPAAEEVLKAEDKGAIASLSPSGLSFDQPAHEYHKAFLEAVLTSRLRS